MITAISPTTYAIMFSLETNKEHDERDIYLHLIYKGDGLNLTLTPEYPEGICAVDVNAPAGSIDTRPSNGSFCITWSPLRIIIDCARYGDGRGGGMLLELEATVELSASLHSALNLWKMTVAGV